MWGHVPSDDITCGSCACTCSAMFGILLTHACPRMSERFKKKEQTAAAKYYVLVFPVYSSPHIVFVSLFLLSCPPSSVTHSLGQCVRQPGLLPGAVGEVRTHRSALAVWNGKNKHNNHNLTPHSFRYYASFFTNQKHCRLFCSCRGFLSGEIMEMGFFFLNKGSVYHAHIWTFFYMSVFIFGLSGTLSPPLIFW